MRRFLFPVSVLIPHAVLAQAFVSGQGGFSALSNAAAASANPIVAASNYDTSVGAAWNVEAGYHVNDWISVQVGYIWNRNRVTSTEISGGAFHQQSITAVQHDVGGDMLLYFRPRNSRVRPYLSAGPDWGRVRSENTAGLRVAVGVDLQIRSRWWFRYSFGEMMSGNPFAHALNPPASGQLMNFQNQFGFMKTF